MIASHRSFVLESEFTFLVFGRLDRFHLLQVDDGEPVDTALVTRLAREGFAYSGIFGLNDRGEAEVRCAPDNPEAIYTMAAAAPTYSRKAAERREHFFQADRESVAWLRSLYDRPDTRD